jgi:hypothetical protein
MYVFYLMRGGWGVDKATLRTPEQSNFSKNIIGNAIEK